MKVNLLGVRGSIPTTGPETRGYGGHTSCVLVSEDNSFVILDAGSGIQSFSSSYIPNNKRVDIVLSHLHMDHIQGLGFFKPIFLPEVEIHIWDQPATPVVYAVDWGDIFRLPYFQWGCRKSRANWSCMKSEIQILRSEV